MGLIAQYTFGNAKPNLLSNGIMNQTNDAYGFAHITLGTGFLKNNTTYTLTICGYTSQVANTNSSLLIYVYDSGWAYQSKYVQILSQKECLTTLTFTTASNAEAYNYCITAYHYPSGSAGQGNTSTVKWYKLEEGSVGTPYTTMTQYTRITDNSGNNRHATAVSCKLSDDAKSGALSLDTQSSGYAQLPSFTLPSAFTICGWVKFVDAFATWSRVFDFGSAAGGGDYAIGLATNSATGNLCVFGRTGGGAALPDTTLSFSAAINTWYHYAIVLNGTNLKVYWDGALVAEWTIAKSLAATYTLNYLGKSNWNDPYSRKYMSDFRIYDRALSSEDVTALYKNKMQIDESYNILSCETAEGAGGLDIGANSVVKTGEFIEAPDGVAIPDTNYERLTHIEFTGTQVIDTKITNLTAPYKIQLTYNKTNTNTSDQCVFGQRQFGKFPNIYKNYYETAFGNTASGTEKGDSKKHTVVTDSQTGFYKDGVSLLSGTLGNASSSYSALIGAFSEDTVANAKWFYKGLLYDVVITNNNELYRHFVPARRKSDSVVGLYDLVTKTFYTNNGTGTLGAGSVTTKVCSNININRTEYERLEYIQSSGTQQINTGVYFDMENDSCQVDFCSTVQNQSGMIFASNNSSNYFWFYHYQGTSALSLYIATSGAQGNIGNLSWDTKPHRMRYFKKSYYIDNTYVGKDTRSLPTTDYPIYLCSWGGAYYYQGRIYGCKIWKKTEMVRDFIPARRTSDGAIGLYDKVTNTFYANSGSGAFIAGASLGTIYQTRINGIKEVL